VPASWSTVSAREPESGDWSAGDVGDPEGDDGEVGFEAEPVQPVASHAARAKLARHIARELFIKAAFTPAQ
jgi:hypothetical protein